jgi:hypothetical protein
MSHRSKRSKTRKIVKGASPRPSRSRETGFDDLPKDDVSTHASGQVPTEDLLHGNKVEVEVEPLGREGEQRADLKIDQDMTEGDQEPRGNSIHAHLLESGTAGVPTWEIVMNDNGMDKHIHDNKKKLIK